MFKLSLIEGIKNIDKNKILTYLTVFLLALGFLLEGYTMSYYAAQEIVTGHYVHESLQRYHLYALSANAPSLQIIRMYPENIDVETAEYFAELDAADNVNYVGVRSTSIIIENFEGDESVFVIEDIDETKSLWCLSVTPNFYEVENYRVIEGRNFTAEDMPFAEGKPRAALLGYKYRDLYEVGDILDVEYNDRSEMKYIRQLEVIGFLAEDTTVMSRTGSEVYDLDNYIVYPRYVIPMEEWDNYEEDVVKYAVNTDEHYCFSYVKYFLKEDTLDIGLLELEDALYDYSQFGKHFKIIDQKYLMEKTESRYEALTSFFATITTVTMFFAIITVLISITNRVARNMKDYAIHIAVGATRGSTIWFIVSEMALILTCSMILGIIATKWITNYISMPFFFWRFLGVYALTSVVILALSAIVARIAMRKYDICTLIK